MQFKTIPGKSNSQACDTSAGMGKKEWYNQDYPTFYLECTLINIKLESEDRNGILLIFFNS